MALLATPPLLLAADASQDTSLNVYGDVRLRAEADWDSTNSSGGTRDDRSRLRTRIRAGFDYQANDTLSFGMRVRTGSDASQQSPHITLEDFDDNDRGDVDLNLDRWFAKIKGGNRSYWIGRNSLPFWKQNELFWDDDVTPLGVAATWQLDDVEVNAGYFKLPVGMREFAGELAMGQVVYRTDLHGANADDRLTLAGGLLDFDADPRDRDAADLLDGNGARDYRTWVLSARYDSKLRERPLALGLDYITNAEGYSASASNPFTAFHRDDTEGFVATASYGTSRAQDWLVAYYYATIDTLALNSSYSQDDWMRWGSATETRSSNFGGHELRFAYGLNDSTNVVLRFYTVEANAPRGPGSVKEDGKRLRVDLNHRF